MRAYLDTNILIAYFWSHYFGSDRRETNEIKLIKQGILKEYELVCSTFSSIEIYQHFRDYYLLDKVIKSGYGYRGFLRMKSHHEVTETERNRIYEMLDDFENQDGINLYKVEKISDDFLFTITDYIGGDIDFFDAIHIRTAIELECNFFVTRDADLRRRYDQLIKKKIITEPMKITTIKGFLAKLKT